MLARLGLGPNRFLVLVNRYKCIVYRYFISRPIRRDPQLQVSGNYSYFTKWRSTHEAILFIILQCFIYHKKRNSITVHVLYSMCRSVYQNRNNIGLHSSNPTPYLKLRDVVKTYLEYFSINHRNRVCIPIFSMLTFDFVFSISKGFVQMSG